MIRLRGAGDKIGGGYNGLLSVGRDDFVWCGSYNCCNKYYAQNQIRGRIPAREDAFPGFTRKKYVVAVLRELASSSKGRQMPASVVSAFPGEVIRQKICTYGTQSWC